jgi:hypothetical protein
MRIPEGRVFTLDALLAQRKIARAIVAGNGHDVMVVKDNQPPLQADITAVFTDPALHRETFEVAEAADRGHGAGRASPPGVEHGPGDYLDWPGPAQVFALTRTRTLVRRTGQVATEMVYGVTGLPRPRADAFFARANRPGQSVCDQD